MRRLKADNLELDSQEVFDDMEQKYGHRFAFFHRADLHAGLRDLVEVPPSGGPKAKIELASEVVKVDREKGILTLADETTIEKDLLVIADGAHVGYFTLTTSTGCRQLTSISVNTYRQSPTRKHL